MFVDFLRTRQDRVPVDSGLISTQFLNIKFTPTAGCGEYCEVTLNRVHVLLVDAKCLASLVKNVSGYTSLNYQR